jgi:anti-sigma factor RsiW
MAEDIRNCRDVEAHLAPYVDGEEPPASQDAIDAHLSACPSCRDHAEAETSARDLVRSHREALGAHASDSLRARCEAIGQSAVLQSQSAIPQSESPIRQSESAIPNSESAIPQSTIRQSAVFSRQAAIRRWVPLSLAATLVLAVAGVFLFGVNDRVEALAASLAVDHVKCFKVEGADKEPTAVVAQRQWEKNQGWSIVVPDTLPSEQLKLVDVRRCFTTDGRSAHMMYTWRGAPLSLYVLPENVGRDRVVDKMGHEAIIWCANSRTYAVVAEGHPQDITRIVDYMKAHAR